MLTLGEAVLWSAYAVTGMAVVVVVLAAGAAAANYDLVALGHFRSDHGAMSSWRAWLAITSRQRRIHRRPRIFSVVVMYLWPLWVLVVAALTVTLATWTGSLAFSAMVVGFRPTTSDVPADSHSAVTLATHQPPLDFYAGGPLPVAVWSTIGVFVLMGLYRWWVRSSMTSLSSSGRAVGTSRIPRGLDVTRLRSSVRYQAAMQVVMGRTLLYLGLRLLAVSGLPLLIVLLGYGVAGSKPAAGPTPESEFLPMAGIPLWASVATIFTVIAIGYRVAVRRWFLGYYVALLSDRYLRALTTLEHAEGGQTRVRGFHRSFRQRQILQNSSVDLERALISLARRREQKTPDSVEATVLVAVAARLQEWRASFIGKFLSPGDAAREWVHVGAIVAVDVTQPDTLLRIAQELEVVEDEPARGRFLQVVRSGLPARLVEQVQRSLTLGEVVTRVGGALTLAWLLFALGAVVVALTTGARPFTDYSP